MRVLLLSPHTDDIEIGAGGTLTKLLHGKDNNFCWVVFSTCENAVPQGLPPDALRNEFTAVASRVNITNYRIHSFPNRNFPACALAILEELDRVKNEFKPDLIIAPSLNDFHQDHRTVAEQAIRVFKKDASIVGYELPWDNLFFQPQLIVELTQEQMEEKWRLLSLYKSQFILKRNYFSKDFIFGWARMRGVQCSAEYAEAFEVTRWIVR